VKAELLQRGIAKLIEDEKWQEVFILSQKEPIEFSRVIEINMLALQGLQWKCLPLHALCSKKPPLRVLHSALRAFPAGARIQDRDGALPLHYACFENQSREFITAVVAEYPEGIYVRNSVGYLPIHLACWIGAEMTVIEDLVENFPGSIQERDYEGEFPIHAACDGRASIDVVKLLVEKYPTSLHLPSFKGLTPYDLAKRKKTENNEILEFLEKKYEMVKSSTSACNTPLFDGTMLGGTAMPDLKAASSINTMTSAIYQKRMCCCEDLVGGNSAKKDTANKKSEEKVSYRPNLYKPTGLPRIRQKTPPKPISTEASNLASHRKDQVLKQGPKPEHVALWNRSLIEPPLKIDSPISELSDSHASHTDITPTRINSLPHKSSRNQVSFQQLPNTTLTPVYHQSNPTKQNGSPLPSALRRGGSSFGRQKSEL